MKLKDYMGHMQDGDELTCWDSVIDSEFYMYKKGKDEKADVGYENLAKLEEYLVEHLEVKEIGSGGVTVNLYELLDHPQMIDYAKKNMFNKNQYHSDEDVVEMLFDDMLANLNDGYDQLSQHFLNAFAKAYGEEREEAKDDGVKALRDLLSEKGMDVAVFKGDNHLVVNDFKDNLVYTDKQIAMLINDLGFTGLEGSLEDFDKANQLIWEVCQRGPFDGIVEFEKLMCEFVEYCKVKAEELEKQVDKTWEGKHLIYSNDYLQKTYEKPFPLGLGVSVIKSN